VITGIVNLTKQVRVRDLNPKDINHLVSVKGIVIRCSDIYPEMKLAHFKCV
jgi:DNA replication licensing factor MCM4